ncbi:hypothetical protein F6P91_06745 [Streptococcus suis]|nr:hypothetical protein [Streptococcus suis]MBO8111659.1 hypothetical protein [Streptococcus suis]MBS8057716.1 hypothetical protein [Streptococcus suis]MBS8089590.1 hypothetical protein [Streptococcus suis]MBS8113089.1 hypothetical protein [Streptococcus suis]
MKQSNPRLFQPINHCAEMLTRPLRSEVGLEPNLSLVEAIKDKLNDYNLSVCCDAPIYLLLNK